MKLLFNILGMLILTLVAGCASSESTVVGQGERNTQTVEKKQQEEQQLKENIHKSIQVNKQTIIRATPATPHKPVTE